MNRKIILYFVLVLMFTVSLNIFAQEVEQNVNDNLSNSIFYSPDYNSIDINDYILRLPEDDMVLEDFGAQYQNKLKELANRYGSNQNNLLDIVFSNEEIENTEPQENLIIDPSSRLNINFGYDQEDKNEIVEKKTAIQVNYNLDDKTALSAEYELQNTQEYDVGLNNIDTMNLEENSQLLRDENNIDTRLGISYQTTDNIRIFADYVYNDILLEQSGESTIFGLEYNTNDNIIAAEYSIIDELETQGRETGLSYQYEDLAKFSASYKLLDPKTIKDQLKQEQSWDFGVDFNLNEDSSFSLGFRVINKELLDANNNIEPTSNTDDTEDGTNNNSNNSESVEETNVEASFQIKF